METLTLVIATTGAAITFALIMIAAAISEKRK